jgi:hypothetical protein
VAGSLARRSNNDVFQMTGADENSFATDSPTPADGHDRKQALSASEIAESRLPPTYEELMLLRRAAAAWELERQKIAEQIGGPPRKVYSAPRRFDLTTIFAVTAAYSLLFGVMSGLNLPPVIRMVVGIITPLVGIGQAMLFGGQKPRLASLLVGAACFAALRVFAVALGDRPLSVDLLFLALMQGAVIGCIAGYIAGVLVGSVFLVSENVRHWFGRRPAA